MRKLLLITYYFPPTVGGGEEYLYNLYKRLSKDKVVVLTPGQPNDFDKEQNFKIYRINFFQGKFKPTWWPLVKLVKKIIQKEKIEIIHFGHYAHYVLLARILKIPYLTFIQGTDLTSYTKSWFGKFLTKSNLKHAQKIITCSHFLKNQVIKLGILENKIQVIYPGLNLEQYDFKLKEGEIRESRLQNHKVILSVGRLVKIKGFDLVIKALPKILKQIPKAVYIIVGAGPEKENLKNLANKLGVSSKIIFTGEIRNKKELSKYYASADVYVGPSRVEAFGIVFLEAQAFGLPIVASNIGGIPEAIGDRGILVKPDDLESLIQNIIKILKAKNLSTVAPMGKYPSDKSSDWNKKIEEIEKILNNTV